MAHYDTSASAEKIEGALCKQLEAVRLNRNISQADLAAQAGVSRRTITRLERGDGVSLETFIRVVKALGLANNFETLIPRQTIQPIDRVKENRPAPRQRASKKKSKSTEADSTTPWTWGDE